MSIKEFDGDNEAIHEELESLSTNNSGNKPFSDVLAEHMTRRDVMRGSLAAAVAAFFTPQDLIAGKGGNGKGKNGEGEDEGGNLINFTPVSIADYAAQSDGGKMPVISPDYEYQVLIPWGTPIKPGVPEYDGTGPRPTAAQQENQIGIGHDGMWLFAENGTSNEDGVLCINHEFGTNAHVLGKPSPLSLEDVRLSQAAHGCSVVRVGRDSDGKWDVVFDNRNRRITVN